MILWFNNFPSKEKCKFLYFDIIDFYSSISEQLLTDGINFARQLREINDDEVSIILHCKKSLLFSRDGAWIKKNGSLFDVAMDSFDGVEICKLVGLFLLNNLTQLVGRNNIGLYRDDGLAILKNASGPSSELIKKRIIKLFQRHVLKIIAETNLVQTNFLVVTLDLKSGRYWPFRNPNDQPLYIHRLSNHPPVIKKQLPLMLATRPSQLSCDSKKFSKAVPKYVEAMHRSGHTGKLEYADNLDSKKKKKRKRNIIWFNPPFSEHVKTNIGQEILRLLAKHFSLHHQLHKTAQDFKKILYVAFVI